MPFAATGAIIGGGKQASAAKQAAATQAASANHATDLAHEQFQQTRQDQQPWQQAGSNALGAIQSQLPALTAGFDPTKQGIPAQFHYNPSDMQADPAFQSAMKMGQQAIERSAAARGNALGGATLKALDQFGTDTANQYYNQDYSRALNTYQQNYGNAFNTFSANQGNAFNRLSSLAGTGQTAVNQLGAAGQNYANQAGNNAMAAGNAASAGIIGGANGFANAIGGATGALGSRYGQSATNWLTGKAGSLFSSGTYAEGGSLGHDIPSTSTQWGDD